MGISGGTLWPALLSITDAGGAGLQYTGVTGRIDFGGSVEQRVPLDKRVTVVRFFRGNADASLNVFRDDRDTQGVQPWCPFER